jgi:ketosteroid isomerase-like protein
MGDNNMTNTAVIESVYAAFRRGDIAAILASLTDDVQWTCEGPAVIPYSGARTGPAQVMGFFQGLSGNDEMKLEVATFVEQGDIVASTGRFKGVVRSTGKPFDTFFGHFFTVRNGKIARFIDLTDTAALAEAHTAR